MKILHVIPTLGSGGAEKMLVDIVEKAKSKGLECDIAVLTNKNNFFGEALNRLGVKVFYSKCEKIYSVNNIFFIKNIIKKNNYDVIHTHLFSAQLFTPIACKFISNNPILITTEHSTHNKRRNLRFMKIVDEFMYSQYKKIVSITNGTNESLIKYLPRLVDKTVVIENGIDIERYLNAQYIDWGKLLSKYEKGDKIILMVAAMREQKDHETVIKASKLLPANYKTVFVGEGERLDYLKSYAEKFGVNVTFLGRRTDVEDLMKSADIFVLSSHWEGFGLVVVEAAASGTNIIASNVEGLKDVVTNIGGQLFNKGDEKDLATKIIKFIDFDNNMLDASKYDINYTVEKYIDVYKGLI